MRLLKRQTDDSFCLVDTLHDEHAAAQPYAILSHRWVRPSEEVTFEDIERGTGSEKLGYKKIEFCAERARQDNLAYFWVDSCCIRKSNDAELTEAINSMFDWYRRASRCYVYLSDVSVEEGETSSSTSTWIRAFRESEWHLRGWTLQELLAPSSVEFFSNEGQRLGDKDSLSQTIQEVTGINPSALRGTPLSEFSVEERFDWASKRVTTRGEDWAYSLLGIFGLSMPAIYGEGRERAVARLKREIKATYDIDLDFQGQFADSLRAPVRTYVSRPALTDQVRSQLLESSVDTNTKIVVVWGLGGVGKTQLVLDYAQQYGKDYRAWFWIEAGQRQTLDRDLINLYYTLHGGRHVAGQEQVGVDTAVLGVKSWFARRQGPWLLVFDGADSIEDSAASDYIDIKSLIPNATSLHVVITSRSGVAKGMTQLGGIQVGDMEESQAVELFYRCSDVRRDEQNSEEIRNIVKELGYLALAVTLAGTYVGTTRDLQTDISAYLPEYRQRRRELLQQSPQSLVHQYSESVLTTWETSFKAMSKSDCPEAAMLLTMISFLSSDDVFPSLFNALVQTTPEMDKYKTRDCFRTLERYSFLQWKEDQQSFAMHKLVHAWGFDRLMKPAQRLFGIPVLAFVTRAVAACSNRPEDKLRLLPHIMANFTIMSRLRDQLNELGKDPIHNFEAIALFLGEVGRFDEQYALERVVLDARQRFLDKNHPDTLRAMDNLACTLRNQGKFAEAAQILRDVVEKKKQILGEEHPDTIRAMNNLAITLSEEGGNLDEAAQIHLDVLQKALRTLGEDHPYTLSTMNNVVATLSAQGRLEDPTLLQRDVLRREVRILGEEHPNTLRAMYHLSARLADQGQLEEAAEIQRKVLETRSRILGEGHLETLITMNRLAATLLAQGQTDEAASLHQAAVMKARALYGDDSPHTKLMITNVTLESFQR